MESRMEGVRREAGFVAVAVLALALVLSTAPVSAVTSPYLTLVWTRVGTAPLIPVGPSGSWDERYVIAGPVVYANGTYNMFYTGSSSAGGYSIGRATSPDGLNWTKDPANPVIPNAQSAAVLFEGGQFRMWYTTPDRLNILYATSADGRAWNLTAPNPALVAGPGWDGAFISAGAVLHNATGYYLYYTGSSDLNLYQGGLATSADGLHWIKYAGNPVLPAGISGAWDSMDVTPSAIFDAGAVRVLWYVGGTSATGYVWRIGVAVSQDGVHWTAANGTALTVSSQQGAWDSQGLSRPAVLSGGTTFRMWYTGLNTAAQWQVGLAQSSLPPGTPSGPPGSSTAPGFFETSAGVLAAVGIITGVAAAGFAGLLLAIRGPRRRPR